MSVNIFITDDKRADEKAESGDGSSVGKSKRRFPDFGYGFFGFNNRKLHWFIKLQFFTFEVRYLSE